MRLPFLQMESDLIAHGAAEVAHLAGCPVPLALGHIAMMRAWAVSAADDSAPPDGMVTGEAAGRRLEAAAQWTGERGRLLQALLDSGQVRSEDGGIRVLHLEPYAKAWEQNRTSKERMRKSRERSRNIDERPAKFDGQTQTQTQTQKEETALSLSSDLFGGLVEKPKDGADSLRELWNASAHPALPRWRDMTDKRRKAAVARLAERPLAEWATLIQRINASDFCLGNGSTGWKADVEFLLRPDSATKLLEGKYDNRDMPGAAKPPPKASDPGWVTV